VPTPAQPTRRAVVVGLSAAAGVTLAGCSAGTEPHDLPGAAAEPVAADPDQVLVRKVRRDEMRLYDLVVSTRKRHRELRSPLREVAKSHLDHIGRLTPGTSLSILTQQQPVAKNPARALADLAAAERGLAREHAASALEARSGALARVVASMSAAAAQRASVLVGSGPGTTGGRS
jgi:hypothetical protein